MKILLVYPPVRDEVASFLPHLEDKEGVGYKPPLGILYIAAYLKEKTNHDVKVLDCNVLRYSYEDVLREVESYRPDIVGVTAWTDLWFSVNNVLRLVKEKHPKIFLVAGGPHVSCFPEETLKYSSADAVIVGDGEYPMSVLAECVEKNVRPNGIPGIHFKEHGVHAEKYYIEKHLDSLPLPQRTMLPYKRYTALLGKGGLVTTMITSRGCPYRCTFCKLNFQKTLCRSAQNVLSEIEEIVKLGIKEIEIYDDTFTWSHERVVEICKGIIDRKLDIRWAVRDRVSNANEDTLKWMKKAGCTRIHYGIESGSASILKSLKKNITLEQAANSVSLAKKEGFEVLTFFMLGLPGETEEDMQKTIDFSLKLAPDYCEYSIIRPYPCTEMYSKALSDDTIPEDFWEKFAVAPVNNFQIPYFVNKNFDLAYLIKIRDRAIKRFYFRLKYMIREFRKIRTIKEFKAKFNMGITLVKSQLTPNKTVKS